MFFNPFATTESSIVISPLTVGNFVLFFLFFFVSSFSLVYGLDRCISRIDTKQRMEGR